MEADMPKTHTPIPKLSDTQLVLLGTAAQRDDHANFQLPQSLTAQGAALDKALATLCKRDLIEERRAGGGAATEENHAYGLLITTAAA
jgi:hypothetical protein